MKPYTARQKHLIGTLLDERIVPEDRCDEFAEQLVNMATTKDATALITELFKLPFADPEAHTSVVEPKAGLYEIGDETYRVTETKHGTWYAEKMVLTPHAVRWKYVGHRVSLRNAKLIEAPLEPAQ